MAPTWFKKNGKQHVNISSFSLSIVSLNYFYMIINSKKMILIYFTPSKISLRLSFLRGTGNRNRVTLREHSFATHRCKPWLIFVKRYNIVFCFFCVSILAVLICYNGRHKSTRILHLKGTYKENLRRSRNVVAFCLCELRLHIRL